MEPEKVNYICDTVRGVMPLLVIPATYLIINVGLGMKMDTAYQQMSPQQRLEESKERLPGYEAHKLLVFGPYLATKKAYESVQK